jgi:beta-phosphoglucomutase-like phosphatase (HAD superfamily)
MSTIGILDCFQFFLGAEDYARSKPSPEGYQAAFVRLGVQPHEVLIFEDSEAGITSALAAGARVIAVTGAGHSGRLAEKAHAQIRDFTAHGWHDLGQVLGALLR